MINISVVSYLNSLPFLYGINSSKFFKDINLTTELPFESANSFKNGRADIALVPVGSLPLLSNYKVISDYCIGSDGPVRTVLLLSNTELPKIKTIHLDFHSLTSVKLVKILAESFWKISPHYINTSINKYVDNHHFESAVLIGDKTFELVNQYKYSYDLAEEWKKYTGLPFVFACWVGKENISSEIVDALNSAFKFGIENLDFVAEKYKDQIILTKSEILSYYNENIKYHLGEEQKKSMDKFLSMLKLSKMYI
ncbi:MAG: menaquinone biosynthesis protein [Bacteroidetes bacterium]|nr:menaquinone biosynthesis protein [Bacteroidota bacterium]